MTPIPPNLPRHLKHQVDVALQDTPIVFINGPRQSGKTTLVKEYTPALTYYTLDDDNILNAVQQDPIGFVHNLDRAIIDEIQRAPGLLRAIKLSVDNNRQPGRFLLTGSANLLALPQIGDSLAGRMEILTLLPLSFSEIHHRESRFIRAAQTQAWPHHLPILSQDTLISHVLTGGYPEMLTRANPARRVAWAKSYIKAIVKRDVRDISSIEKLVEMPKLLEVLAHQSGNLTNFTQIGGQLGLTSKTAQKYVDLLDVLFLVHQLQPWHHNTLSRLLKTPKVHFLDSGLMACLTRLTKERIEADPSVFGALLETWVYGELLKEISLREESWTLYYYRDKDQVEVDFVLENERSQVIGIEVKASQTIFNQDFKGLRKLATLAGPNWLTGVVLYRGDKCLPFGENLWAVPFSLL
jgi:uncharacterized protein